MWTLNQTIKYRHELKFFVNFHQYYTLRQRLKNLMQHDEHVGPTGEYHIRSLYFDDICNKALAEKLGGISQRKKYRIRIYNLEDKVIHFAVGVFFKIILSPKDEPRSHFRSLHG